ncbi:MAG: AMP-binding protein [Cyclobacteriaceae bacterium]
MRINDLIKKLQLSAGRIITTLDKKKVDVPFPLLYEKVVSMVYHLKKMNLGTNCKLGIISNNDLKWVIADLACIHCGIKLVPLEPSARLDLFGAENFEIKTILIGDDLSGEIEQLTALGVTCVKLSSLVTDDKRSEGKPPHQYDPGEILSYKCTSGSTGKQKVIGQSVESVESTIKIVQELFRHSNNERVLVFLPLNLLQQRYWIYSAIAFEFTVIVAHRNRVFEFIKTERPTVIMGVPCIYEVIQEGFRSILLTDDNAKLEYENYLSQKEGKDNKPFKLFVDYLGGNVNYLWTGSAPIAHELIDFYFDLGVPLYQGYGMNETCIISKNYPGNNKIGSVGKPLPNITIQFDDRNQILVKNKYPVCIKYSVAAQSDQEIFREDGFVSTGDVGYLDDEGYLFINGRIKEMITLASSKKVFPAVIEGKIQASDEVSRCVLCGDRRPYLTAVIVPVQQSTPSEKIEALVNQYNFEAKPEEQIYKFIIVHDQLDEFLTNQNKIKRAKVLEKYEFELNELYNK